MVIIYSNVIMVIKIYGDKKVCSSIPAASLPRDSRLLGRRCGWEVRKESAPAPSCALAVRLGRRENWQSRRDACAKTAFPKCWARGPCRRIGPEGLKNG